MGTPHCGVWSLSLDMQEGLPDDQMKQILAYKQEAWMRFMEGVTNFFIAMASVQQVDIDAYRKDPRKFDLYNRNESVEASNSPARKIIEMYRVPNPTTEPQKIGNVINPSKATLCAAIKDFEAIVEIINVFVSKDYCEKEFREPIPSELPHTNGPEHSADSQESETSHHHGTGGRDWITDHNKRAVCMQRQHFIDIADACQLILDAYNESPPKLSAPPIYHAISEAIRHELYTAEMFAIAHYGMEGHWEMDDSKKYLSPLRRFLKATPKPGEGFPSE